MSFDSPFFLSLKRRRLTDIDSMEAEAAKAKLEAMKEKYGREIHVFETLSTSEPLAEMVNTEVPDDFYEFTAEDFFHIMATKKEEKFLKTRKIREAEETARRSRMTKATIRVRFPDNHTLEAIFHPSEMVGSLVDLLKEVVARPELPFYIYTTPPKKQITNTSENFYSAGFVPGAIVYFSYDLPRDDEAHSGPFLNEDLMSLKGLDLYLKRAEQPTIQVESGAVQAIHVPSIAEEQKPAEKKTTKPKWLKM